MSFLNSIRAILFNAAALSLAAASPAFAEQLIKAAVIKVEREQPLPISRLDLPVDGDGFAGARQATADNATTGGFLGQKYETLEITIQPEEIAATLDQLVADGVSAVVTMAGADDVLAIADHLAATDVIVLNAAATDDRLRNDECRANVLHIAPSRAILEDAMAQYMVWKRWTDWLLIHGSHPEDIEKAESIRRAAKKFGAKIVEERVYEDTGGARRSDSGHVLVQKQIPVFTQRAEDHDVVYVADEHQVFGLYLPYRTWDPRPVVGDAGLVARSWHPAHESWGATQLQRRFEKAEGRRMTDLDYQVWVALRSLGEAATRSGSDNPAAMRDWILSENFEVAAFKGQKLNFREWNNQLRQSVLLADGKLVVTVSPQEEFLHQRTRLDTLGYDKDESTCAFN
ncbi:ABC transporter substrate-binding protein [Rhodobacteraceae bacterium NNCM2]|nr:ABC transporter substrate-binding protein [Coraliihabitans acroporae]